MIKADKIYFGNIETMDIDNPKAEAFCVSGDRIVFVGNKIDAQAYTDENTKVYDYKDAYIYPGFIDAHDHGFGYGFRKIGSFDIKDGKTNSEHLNLMKKVVEENPGRPFYIASGWSDHNDGPLNKDELDKIEDKVPMMLSSIDGHSLLVNTKALEKFNITKEFASKAIEGEVEVDKDGNPTGMLHESVAFEIVKNYPITVDQLKEYISCFEQLAFENGYTGHVEAGSKILSPLQNKAYSELSKEGKLKLYTFTYDTIEDNTDTPIEDVKRVIDLKKELDSKHFSIVGLKIFLDGVLEAQTCLMVDEYKHKKGYHGVARFNDKDKLVSLIKTANDNDLGVHAHSIGDASTCFMLDCIEIAQNKGAKKIGRNCIAHLEFVLKEDIKRFEKTKTVAIVAPMWTGNSEKFMNENLKYVDKQKLIDQYPIKSFIDEGVLVTFHSDFPASTYYSIPLSIFMARERFNYNGLTTPLNANERIDGYNAIKAMTVNVAKQLGRENDLGMIKTGYIANASIFDVDFLKDTKDIYEAKTVATIVDGEEVYKRI